MSLIKFNSNYPHLKNIIYKIETRKVIIPTNSFLERKGAMDEALKFEELYILSKEEFSNVYIGSEMARLTELKRRK